MKQFQCPKVGQPLNPNQLFKYLTTTNRHQQLQSYVGAYALLCHQQCVGTTPLLPRGHHHVAALPIPLFFQPPSNNQFYLPLSPPIMGITTCILASKVKFVKSTTTFKLPQCLECNPTKSPKFDDLNTTLAKINHLRTQFDNALTVLGSTRERNGTMDYNLNALCNLITLLVPNSLKNNTNRGQLLENQVSPSMSTDGIMPNQEPPSGSYYPSQDPTYTMNDEATETVVRINETPTYNPPVTKHATSTALQAPRSLLRQALPQALASTCSSPGTSDTTLSDKPTRKMILNKQHKLLISLDDDGSDTMFHVEDFVNLYPLWPIIELAIAPMGNAKDNRMNTFFKCITSLFGKISYVNDKAAIAPIEITDDNKENYITDKAKLSSNFTKLGRWIMISGGSWVFKKRTKGEMRCIRAFASSHRFQRKELSIVCPLNLLA
jgi:hypothetical protein